MTYEVLYYSRKKRLWVSMYRHWHEFCARSMYDSYRIHFTRTAWWLRYER